MASSRDDAKMTRIKRMTIPTKIRCDDDVGSVVDEVDENTSDSRVHEG
jgi:hypothetical protein